MSEYISSVNSCSSDHKLAREVIDEYLSYMNCEKTQGEFKREFRKKSNDSPRQSVTEIQTKLLRLMSNGDRNNFFQEWDSSFPYLIENEANSTKNKMRFYVEIFFATYSYRGIAEFDPGDNAARLNAFKGFLENEGSELSQSNDFFPYCALVCIKNPTTHRAFKNIFSVDWEKSLAGKLKKFIRKFYGMAVPRLLNLLSKSSVQNFDKKIEQLQQERDVAEKNLDQATKQLNFLESDYRNLIEIAGELIDVLEDTINGKMLTAENLDDIAKKMFNNPSMERIISGRVRINTPEPTVRKSPAKPKTHSPRPKKNTNIVKLNYEKIRQKITEKDGEETSLLLQAIRWRLTNANKQMRKEILHSLVSNDILGCRNLPEYKKSVIECLSSPSQPIRQYMARLINSLASLARGRDYLTLSPGLLTSMITVMKKESGDTVTRQHLIGAIQKMTLRRSFQTKMIKMDLIQWIMQQLENEGSLSDYSLEYGVALVMNLCLIRSGREVCVPNAKKYLPLLLRLLESKNAEIQPYIHGTLYTLLSDLRIRSLANKIDMETQLKRIISTSSSEDAAQIHHIIRRLQDDENQQAKSDEEEEADNSEDDPDMMEPDLNEKEIVKKSPAGEELLAEKYSCSSKSGGDFYMTRPQTPMRASSRVRQSSRPILPTEKNEDLLPTEPEDVIPIMALESKLEIRNHDEIFAARPRIARTPDVEFG